MLHVKYILHALWGKRATQSQGKSRRDSGWGAIVGNLLTPSVQPGTFSIPSNLHLSCPFCHFVVGEPHNEGGIADPASLQHGRSVRHDE